MPGTASLADNLVNDLVLVADELRGLRGDFGQNPWAVYRVVRTWSGARPGAGTATDVATEITPTPRVGWVEGESGRIRFDLPPTGMYEKGEIVLAEVSLTYTFAEVKGTTASANLEVFYKLTDAQGNGMADRWFTVSAPPAPDREKSIGWVVSLRAKAGT